MDFLAAAVPSRYRVTFTDNTSATARSQAELVGLINQYNQAEVVNRQTVRSALRGAQAPWFLRTMAAARVQSIERV